MTESVKKLKEAHSLLTDILAQDPENSVWKTQHLNIRTLLNYYQLQTSFTRSQKELSLTVDIDEILDESSLVSAKANATHLFQDLGRWEVSEKLLVSLEDTGFISENIRAAVHAKTLNTENLKTYIPYQLANIRQSLHKNREDINAIKAKCEDLYTLVNTVIHESQHPLYLQAYVFSGYCLNKQNTVSDQRAQLARMKVPLPHYFSIINKELINDNTTQL